MSSGCSRTENRSREHSLERVDEMREQVDAEDAVANGLLAEEVRLPHREEMLQTDQILRQRTNTEAYFHAVCR
jgi:hypothetical protein